MPAIRLLDTEHQTELAYLHEQLIEGEPVQDKSWRYAEEYLMQLGIYNVILVEENDVRNYKRFLLEDRDCTIRAANSMTSFLRNKKAYWKLRLREWQNWKVKTRNFVKNWNIIKIVN